MRNAVKAAVLQLPLVGAEPPGNLLSNTIFTTGWNDVFGGQATLTSQNAKAPTGKTEATTFSEYTAGSQWQAKALAFTKAASTIDYWWSMYWRSFGGAARRLNPDLGSADGNNGFGYGSGFSVLSDVSKVIPGGWTHTRVSVRVDAAITSSIFAIYITNITLATSNFQGTTGCGLYVFRPRIALLADGY
jgi:hypothetical protein